MLTWISQNFVFIAYANQKLFRKNLWWAASTTSEELTPKIEKCKTLTFCYMTFCGICDLYLNLCHPRCKNREVNPSRPGLFSCLPGPDAKNQGQHQPIEIKLCMSHYSNKKMPDAKFEPNGFSIFGDMTSQNFPLKEGTSHRIRI